MAFDAADKRRRRGRRAGTRRQSAVRLRRARPGPPPKDGESIDSVSLDEVESVVAEARETPRARVYSPPPRGYRLSVERKG